MALHATHEVELAPSSCSIAPDGGMPRAYV
jgi:hypothetical protein